MEALEERKITQEEIDEVISRLINVYAPKTELIYLFGSYAWGKPDKHSDLDIMVVVKDPDESEHELAVKGHRALWGINISVDILAYPKEKYNRLVENEYSFCNYIVREGKKVYES